MGNMNSHPSMGSTIQNSSFTVEQKQEPQPILSTIEESKEEKLDQPLSESEQFSNPITKRNDLIDNAKSIIDAANIKIKTLNERCKNYSQLNKQLESKISELEFEEKEKHNLSEQYRIEIENQKSIIIKWKDKMQELSEEIIVIREKEREQELQYANKNISISDNLYKISGDSVSKLKYNQKHKKLVVFTEKINHLFYYDENGLKLVFVRGISISNNEIESQINNKPWFLIIGKKRKVLFTMDDIKIRDKWVNFINRSLANKSNHDSDDEISVMTSVVDIDYDINSNDVKKINRASTTTNFTNFTNHFSHRRGNKNFNSLTVTNLTNNNKKISNGRRKKNHRSNSLQTFSTIDEPINVMVMYDIKENKIEFFLKVVKQLIIETNKEKGCVKFNIHKDRKYKNKFVMMEIWESQKYLTMHLQQAHLKKYRDVIAKNNVHKSKPNVFFCNNLL